MLVFDAPLIKAIMQKFDPTNKVRPPRNPPTDIHPPGFGAFRDGLV